MANIGALPWKLGGRKAKRAKKFVYNRNGIRVVSQIVVHHSETMQRIDNQVERAIRYLAGVTRNQARRSIRVRRDPNEPHSDPYGPIARGNAVIYRTIEREWDPRRRTVVVGPRMDAFRAAAVARTGTPDRGFRVPQLLEYGGTQTIPADFKIPAKRAPMRWKRREVARLNALEAQKPDWWTNKRTWTVGDLQTVTMTRGTYTVLPRPTMRLAWNRTIVQTNSGVQWAFARAGRNVQRVPINVPTWMNP